MKAKIRLILDPPLAATLGEPKAYNVELVVDNHSFNTGVATVNEKNSVRFTRDRDLDPALELLVSTLIENEKTDVELEVLV